MARYLNVVYGTDTYGVRIREDVPLTATATDWENIRIDIGAVPSDYPKGTRLVLLRKTGYWPPLPYDNNKPPHLGGQFVWGIPSQTSSFNPKQFFTLSPATRGTACILPAINAFSMDYGKAFQPDWDENHIKTWIVGFNEPPETIFDVAIPGVPVYYRIYASEPMGLNQTTYGDGLSEALLKEQQDALSQAHGATIACMWTPWEIRNQAFVVPPARLRGVETMIDAIPTGIMTGGDVYGVVDADSVQYKYLSHVGFLADLVQTDGALIVDDQYRLHSNMVEPMLRGFGLDEEELLNINAYYATWNHIYESPYLKNLLFNYRDISMRKGTEFATVLYALSAFNKPPISLSIPENLLLCTFDSSPGEFQTPTGSIIDGHPSSIGDERGTEQQVSRLRDCSVGVFNATWSRQYTGDSAYQNPTAGTNTRGYWVDVMSQHWTTSGQDSLVEPEATFKAEALIPRPIVKGDPWWLTDKDVGHYRQYSDFVWEIGVDPNQEAAFGSARVPYNTIDHQGNDVDILVPNIGTSLPLPRTGGFTTFRFKTLRRETFAQRPGVADLWVTLDWLDEDGEYIEQQMVPLTNATQQIAALNANKNTWVIFEGKVRAHRLAKSVAWNIHIKANNAHAPMQLVLALGAIQFTYTDLNKYPAYRNPQSVAVCVDYGKNKDGSRRIPPALEIINTAKLDVTMVDLLSSYVTHRMVTSLTDEYDDFVNIKPPPPDPNDPTYASTRIDYTGSVYSATGQKTHDKVITYGHTAPLP